MKTLDTTKKNKVLAEVYKSAGTARLGNIAKSATPPTSETLEKIRDTRRRRYELLSSIRSCYIAEGKKKGLFLPTEYHRTSLCKHAMTGAEVHLFKKVAEVKKGYFVGLQTCGSVWTCPICANRIQEVRRQEIATAMDYFYKAGKQAVMVTFTFPHTAADGLKELLEKFSKSLHDFKSGNPWTKFKNKYGFEGLIRSLEITRGGNGWHPHTHELMFIDKNVNGEDFKKWMLERWLRVCIKSGLVDANDFKKQEQFLEHSLDLKFNCSTSDYLAKFDDKSNWGIDREIAKASTKKGKSDGMHPFELAHRGYNSLFIEYTEAIKGRAQLFWSRGLKEKVGLNNIQDEEITEENEDDNFIGALDKDHWGKVIKTELRAKVLEMVEDGKKIEYIRLFIFRYFEKILENGQPTPGRVPFSK